MKESCCACTGTQTRLRGHLGEEMLFERRENETTEVASRAECRVGPMRLVYLRLDWHRCRGQAQGQTEMEHQVRGARNLALPELSEQPQAAPRLRTQECPRRAVPPIRRRRSPAHLLPGQPETHRRSEARKEQEWSTAFSYRMRFPRLRVSRLRGCASQRAGTALRSGERIYSPIVLLLDGGGKGHRPTKVGKAMKNM